MNTNNVFAFAKWQIKKESVETVFNLLPGLVKKSKEEKGNIQYNIYRSNTEQNTLILFEAYKDEAGLQAHKNSSHYQEIVVKQIIPLLEKREISLASELSF